MNMLHTLLATLALTLSLTVTSSQAQTALKVESPWARPTVQGQAAGGGYVRIVGGAADDKLLSASSAVAGRVELHTMSMEGDVMRMRQVDDIAVPAGQTVDLKPGGLHMMFMDLKAPLKTGSNFPLTLRFQKAGELKVDVKVQPAAPGGTAGNQGMAGQEHKH
jgi:hypothetical protein